MDNAHIVRHIRYSEIDALPQLTWEEKQQLRAKIKKKRIDPPVSLEKLKAADNREWAVFIEMLQPGLARYLEMLTDDRFSDDIISESIVNIFISRHMYNSVDHMIGSLHQFARYESFARGNKRSTRLLLPENIELFMNWEAYVEQHEDEDLALRKQKEDWKDKMLNLIRHAASGLPPKWRAWIYLRLSDKTKSEVWRESKTMGMGTGSAKLCMRRLKYLVEAELYGERIDVNLQEVMIKDVIMSMHKKHLDIVRSFVECNTLKEAESALALTSSVYKGRMELVLRKLRKVYDSPYIRSPFRLDNRFSLIKNIPEEYFWRAVKEGIKSNTGGMKVRWSVHIDVTTVNKIVLLRDQQQMSWENIGRNLHMDQKTVKRIYTSANPNVEIRDFKGDFDKTRKITMQDAVEMRRLYKTGDYTQPQLAAKYGISRSTIQGIVENRKYKETA